MSNKQFFNNLSATYADVRKLDVKKINLKGKNILEYIEESVPTIKHANDTRETVYENDLWGQWVETKDDGTIVIHDDYLSNPNSEGAWNSEVKAVQDNKAYSEITTDDEGKFTGVVESSVIANIQTEMIKASTDMFMDTPLASFNGDLSSLVIGDDMFRNTSLASFSGDLSNLVNSERMFMDTPLASFSGDLSSLIDGERMFYNSSLASFSSDLSSLVNGSQMFDNCTSLTSFNGDLSNLSDGSAMFSDTSLESFNGNLSSLVNGSVMFSDTPLTSFSGDLSSLIDGFHMFMDTPLASFSGDLSSLINGYDMFRETSLTPQSVMYIVESIRNIAEEIAKYTSGEIPWVTLDSTTYKYSAPFGFMKDGKYVYTYNDPNPYTTTIPSSQIRKLTLGIDVSNDSDTIEQQLQTFAEGCLCDSWAELKQEFVDKGWTVTFQYGGTDSSIVLSEDEQFRGVPVYARLIEVSEEEKDRAEYCTEDGTKFYNIDWGHDVTDYDQYQYFGSLLEACGYFGVIPKKYLEV